MQKVRAVEQRAQGITTPLDAPDPKLDAPALPLAGEHMAQVQTTMTELLQRMQAQNE